MLTSNDSYLIAISFTIAIEMIVAILFGYRKRLEIAAVVLVNLITNPLLNYILSLSAFNYFLPSSIYYHLLLGLEINKVIILSFEIIIIFIEWLLLMFALQENPKKLFFLSLAMNFCSFAAGCLISLYIPGI